MVFQFCLMLALTQNTYAYNPYSTRELDELEKEFASLIQQSAQVIRHPLITNYINRLGKRLTKSMDFTTPYFFIVKSNEINAFAGPGGYIAINSRLILATDTESELAAVMAHEIAHVRQHHLYRMLEHQKQMRIPMLASVLASLALGVVNPTLGGGALMASLTGLAQDNINYTRANEKEADRIGIEMLIQAGMDPRGMAGFFKKMQQNSRYYYSNLPAILRTHPLDDDRIAEAENRYQHLLKKTFKENPDYFFFKELIRNLANHDHKQLLDYYAIACKNNKHISCQYGYALALMKINNYAEAEEKLITLSKIQDDNFYIILALAEVQIKLKKISSALTILKKLYHNYPENYAIILTYTKALISAANPELAASILLKASRIYSKDLNICQELARTRALLNQTGYAYFTSAQCELLKGNKKTALSQLKIAKRESKKDRLLLARIDAKIEEIKYLI